METAAEKDSRALYFISRTPRDAWIAAGFVVVALTVRLVYHLHARPEITGDIERYMFIAKSLASGDLKNAVNYVYPPLFPVFILLFRLVSGSYQTASWLVALVMAAVSTAPVYYIGLKVFGRRAAFFAAGFYALRYFHGTTTIQQEQQLVFFLVTGILLGLVSLERRRWWLFLVTGAVWGAGFLTKPEAWAYFLLFMGMTGLAGLWVIFKNYFASRKGVESRARRREKQRAEKKRRQKSGKGQGEQKTGKDKAGKEEDVKSRAKESPERERIPARPFFNALPFLLIGYFSVTSLYLASYYFESGRFSANPKATTLFMIHNEWYRGLEVYRIQQGEEGFYTLGQRIFFEGGKDLPEASIGGYIMDRVDRFPEIYSGRFWHSLLNNFPHYLQRIAPWVWVLLAIAGLVPGRGRRFLAREAYLHAYALVPILSIPLFSAGFPRFYYSLVPWFMLVLGRGSHRVVEIFERLASRMKLDPKKAAAPVSALVLLALLFGAVWDIAGADVDSNKEFWDEIEYREKVAHRLRDMLPQGCRFMAEAEDVSMWYLGGFEPERQELLPINRLDTIIDFAAKKRCKHLVFHPSGFQSRFRHLFELLKADFKHPLLKRAFRGVSPNGNVYVIYQVLPTDCG